MSPRAAWRLETLGFRSVHDYVAGKIDWLAAGLPTEGDGADQPRVGRLTRRDVPRSRLDERVGDAAIRAREAGWQMSAVVNNEGIVLGVLDGAALGGDPDQQVESAMRPGPSTFRAHLPVEELSSFLGERNLRRAILTTPEGELIGVVFADDLHTPASGASAPIAH